LVASSRTCRASKEDGSPCQAPPLRDGLYCRLHDPEIADAVQEARRLGGLRRRRESTVALAFDFDGLDTIPQIRRLIEVAAFDTLGLDNSIARARALAYLAQVATTLLEKGEMEERMAAVEAALGPRVVAAKRR
jgi:hypothetical protein